MSLLVHLYDVSATGCCPALSLAFSIFNVCGWDLYTAPIYRLQSLACTLFVSCDAQRIVLDILGKMYCGIESHDLLAVVLVQRLGV